MALQVCRFLCPREKKPIDRCHSSSVSPQKTSSTIKTRTRICEAALLSKGVFFLASEVIGSSSRRKMSRSSVLKCSLPSDCNQTQKSGSDQLAELPLLPLPLVLFPGSTLPLQIFEFRYRIMMHTLLQNDLRFGIIYSGVGPNGGAVSVGCVGEVIKHERLVDDRFFVICKGQERFRVVNMVRTKPYMVAEVEWLEDCPPPSGDRQDLESLALEVETCMKDVIRLSNKLDHKPADNEADEDLRRCLLPTPFSFFVASTFEGAPKEQQALLELEDTAVRLSREKEMLTNTRNYLAAASAVRDAFQYSSFNEN